MVLLGLGVKTDERRHDTRKSSSTGTSHVNVAGTTTTRQEKSSIFPAVGVNLDMTWGGDVFIVFVIIGLRFFACGPPATHNLFREARLGTSS